MKEIKAIEAFGTPYMTQSAEVKLEQRLFVTALSGKVVNENNWRGATVEEKTEWQKVIEELNPVMYNLNE